MDTEGRGTAAPADLARIDPISVATFVVAPALLGNILATLAQRSTARSLERARFEAGLIEEYVSRAIELDPGEVVADARRGRAHEDRKHFAGAMAD